MDTFFEQIMPIKKTAKTVALFLGIWLLAVAVILCCMLFLLRWVGAYIVLLVCGVLYGAYKLSFLLSVEYEYIITNGSFDVDKIIAKSRRKRMASFELSDVQSLEKYNPNAKNAGNYKKTVFACNATDDAYSMVISLKDGGNMLIVFAPNERMREAAVKFLPKFIANSAFKD